MSIKLLDKACLTEDEVLEVLGITSDELKILVYTNKVSKYSIRGKFEYMPSNIKKYLLSLKEDRKNKEILKHYENSKSSYDIIGESHLEYYRDKFPDNYKKLKEILS